MDGRAVVVMHADAVVRFFSCRPRMEEEPAASTLLTSPQGSTLSFANFGSWRLQCGSQKSWSIGQGDMHVQGT